MIVTADPATCQFQFNPTGTKKFTSSCDIAKAKLSAASVNYENVAAAPGSVATIKIGEKIITSYDASGLSKKTPRRKTRRCPRNWLTTSNWPAIRPRLILNR